MGDVSIAAPNKPLVAYFCMEYGLDNSFKIFSGGLGILAGDYVKAARDADYPMVAVGLLWRQGYTSQTIGENGLPVDAYPEYRYSFLKDTEATVEVEIKGKPVKCKIWLCDCFGNIPLYLLDTFMPGNPESLITGQLYGWFADERLAQEIILGVGGVRALEALGVRPDIYHFNEGHAALAGLELIKREMGAGPDACGFLDAWARVRNRIVFTTHTPVKAGNESHNLQSMKYVGADLGFTRAELRKIGGDPFNMTVAGLNLSYLSNAVSQLHAKTANKMWARIRLPHPIIGVTNGVHNGTWQDSRIAQAAARALADGADASQVDEVGAVDGAGAEAGVGDGAGAGAGAGVGAEARAWEGELLAAHRAAKAELIDEIEKRTAAAGDNGGAGVRLAADRLLVGFARRAAPYKRSDLLFRDPDAVSGLLESGRLQIVFSGKAHPNDSVGKEIVANIYAMAKRNAGSIVFLQNYDMEIGRLLTRGCDVWLNNPIRPMEASGTSGMKAAMNGVLNLSVLDGWWPEGCEHGVNGWQIGGGYEGDECDSVDGQSLVETLIGEVIPAYYDNPGKWAQMMLRSVEMSQSRFSAARMLEDYVERMYCAAPH